MASEKKISISSARKSSSDEIWVNDFTEESAQEFREAILEINNSNSMRPIIVYIDSYGGQVDALAKMIDTLDEVTNPIITCAMGKAMSCGAILLSHGDIRFCAPNSRIMIHEVSAATHGDVHDMHADVAEIKRLNEHFLGILAKNCDIKTGYKGLRDLIKSQDGRDKFLSPEEAKKFGIVDMIGTPKITPSIGFEISVAQLKPAAKLSKSEPEEPKGPKRSKKTKTAKIKRK